MQRARNICQAVLVASLMASPGAVSIAFANGMPAAEQNALIGKYCAVCHTDAARNGGLSLEHYNAARIDPGVAAMVLSKLKSGAIGAAGLPEPDKPTQEAWIRATEAEAVGADKWVIDAEPRPSPSISTASIVREVPATVKDAPLPDSYRLTLTCNADTREGEIELSWSPAVPHNGTVVSASADGKALPAYKVEGTEKMGNGANGSSGPGSILLYVTRRGSQPTGFSMPSKALTIANAFPNEIVEFPFSELPRPARKKLSACFHAGR
jgi:hypothetical protein